MIGAGSFDQRITLQSKSVTRNAHGEEIVTWGDVATVWARLLPPAGKSFYSADQQQHAIDARFLIRQRSGLAENMRLQWRGDNYDIVSIVPQVGNYAGTLELNAVHGVRDGR